jgi:hypothetical protein
MTLQRPQSALAAAQTSILRPNSPPAMSHSLISTAFITWLATAESTNIGNGILLVLDLSSQPHRPLGIALIRVLEMCAGGIRSDCSISVEGKWRRVILRAYRLRHG